MRPRLLTLASLAPLALLAVAHLVAAPIARAQCPPLPASQDRCYAPAYLSTQWTTVYPNEGKVYHVAEGVCTNAEGGLADDCLSHRFYDYNMDLAIDPAYRCLLADTSGLLHTEREMLHFPVWVWPSPGSPTNPFDGDGDRVWMQGPLIYDCGHCDGGSDLTGCYTEIHPILAMASIRNRPDTLGASGQSGLVPVTRADVWIHGDAGCINALQCVDDTAHCPDPWPGVNLCGVNAPPFPIDRVWTFALALPPRPSAGATPVWRFESRPGDAFSQLTPAVTVVPATGAGTRDSLRLTIDLTGTTGPGPFARSLVAGWTPGWSSVSIHHLRVDVPFIRIIDDMDGSSAPSAEMPGGGEWFFSIEVNGIWQELLGNLKTGTPATVTTGQTITVDKSWDVAVPDTGALLVNSSGFEVDETFGCSIKNNDPGDFIQRWTLADNFGIGTHTVKTVGGDVVGGAAGMQYTVTEVEAPTAVAEPGGEPEALAADRVVVGGRGVDFTLTAAPPADHALRIYSPAGRMVRLLPLSDAHGAWSAHWDGRDESGRRVAAGVYVVAAGVSGNAASASRRVIVLQ